MGNVIEVARILESCPDLCKTTIAIVAVRSVLLAAEIFALHVRSTTGVDIRVFVDMEAAELFCRN
jgi:hypothetical protein